MVSYNYVAPCLFGLEGLLSEELKKMGAADVNAQNGRVLFSGDAAVGARANICSRFAERILLSLGSFAARTFDELFEGTKALPLYEFIGKRDAFPVKGWSLESALYSIPDCQKIIKKAAAVCLGDHYKIDWLEESGCIYQLLFSIHKDVVTLSIDLSGEGLHKRGYRRNSADAPIKETLAAAIVYLSRIYHDSAVYDPFCGSGTILIEAATQAMNIAPGLNRSFAAERFPAFPEAVWQAERQAAINAINRNVSFVAYGSDIDPAAVALTLENAKKAGVAEKISVKTVTIEDFEIDTPRAVVITNPPYGERLLDIEGAAKIYAVMGRVFGQKPGFKYSIISPSDQFEQEFGRPADKRRKLYNGMIKCQLFMYYKYK